MDVTLANKIGRQLQRELIRRQLIEYFVRKGYESNFNKPLYPPTCWDLSVKVKDLFNKVEIIPFSEETDVSTGVVKLGWNLYVFGTNRLNLGYTTHTNASDIQRSALGESRSDMPIEYATTPHEVIDFVIEVLDNNKSGYTRLPPNYRIPPGALDIPLGTSRARSPRVGPTASGAFYSR